MSGRSGIRGRGPSPRLWASRVPFGIGKQRPNNYREITRAGWENRDEAAFALRILREGVCDGCALGTSGMRDWTLDGVHLCNVRLRLLRLNTIGAFDPDVVADVAALEERTSAELRALGRIPVPLLRRAGERGFRPVAWEDALELAADRLRRAGPDRIGFYLTSRGTTNETYYAAQKAARALGTNSIDNAARVCHSPSTVALKDALGVAATTCSYTDLIESQLIVFVGANPANNQPVTMKYLHHAKKNGARIAVVNPYREPGMERYWIPSIPESALFGTKIADDFFQVSVGGDAAFFNGALKALIERGAVMEDWVAAHTEGFAEVAEMVGALDWKEIEAEAGVPRGRIEMFAAQLARVDRAVLVWSMGVTQHARGEEAVASIVNLGLARALVGRDGCGLMPIRGHSGVQGGAEMGCYATALPGGVPVTDENAARLSELWGFEVPTMPGLTAPEMLDAAHDRTLDVLVSVGGNFLEVMPDPERVRTALSRVPLRVHVDIVLSSQMLVPAAEDVLVLPATTRYEVPGGVTQTSTERRVIFSPEVAGRRIEEARPEWWLLGELAARARPGRSGARFAGTAEIRAEIARAVPDYAGIEDLREQGDQFQYGGRHLCVAGEFPTPSGRARFTPVELAGPPADDGRLALVTRRGKQFNSMVQEAHDAITGLERDSVAIAGVDAERLGLRAGDRVALRSDVGVLEAVVILSDVAPGTVQVHWPEANVLVRHDVRSPRSKVPAYEARVTIEPV